MKEAVVRELEFLAGKGDGLRYFFLEEGTKGVRHEAANCPIANHLRRKFPLCWFSVKYAVLLFREMPLDAEERIPMPGALNDFAYDFDNECYPELEEECP